MGLPLEEYKPETVSGLSNLGLTFSCRASGELFVTEAAIVMPTMDHDCNDDHKHISITGVLESSYTSQFN